jgi:outer membrane protein OmpA-like peptidoglycan-associated protein
LNTSIATRVEMIKFDVTLEGALFDVGSYVLKPAAKASIRNIGEFMNWKTDVNILVEGFTDHTGSEEDNLILSQNRANAVRDYLINEYHISPDRIETTGYGEAFPVADNNTREGRALNRRVEIIMNSNFEQKGSASDPVLRDDTKLRVENKRIHTINEDMPQ